MKGKELMKKAVRAEFSDKEKIRESCIGQEVENIAAKKFRAKPLFSAAAFVAVVLVAVLVFPHFSSGDFRLPELIFGRIENQSSSPLEADSGDVSKDESEFQGDSQWRGLAVENFSLANAGNGSVAMDRIAYTGFGSLIEWGMDCFVAVKVTDTQIEKNKYSGGADLQISDARILSEFYGTVEAETIQIRQSVYENHFCLGSTNLLREGGVYLLPLAQSEGNWYAMGDMDVLLEVDNQGNIWSHSAYEEFYRFDGKDIDFFEEEFQNLMSNEDFMQAYSAFGSTLQHWTLADITITDKSNEKTLKNGEPGVSYTFYVNEILSEPGYTDIPPLKETGSIDVDNSAEISFVAGNRYLLFLDRYAEEIYVNAYMIATIGADEVITAIPASISDRRLGESVFSLYDGYKMEEIRKLVSRIHLWYEEND